MDHLPTWLALVAAALLIAAMVLRRHDRAMRVVERVALLAIAGLAVAAFAVFPEAALKAVGILAIVGVAGAVALLTGALIEKGLSTLSAAGRAPRKGSGEREWVLTPMSPRGEAS